MKAIQKFSDEYLELCKTMTPEQIVKFLEDFRTMHGGAETRGKSQLISMKVPKPMLSAFKTRCRLSGIPYQTQIKKLMNDWLNHST